MDSNIFNQLRKLFIGESVKINIRLAVFGFFLIIASILWYLNRLNSEFTTDITYPLKVVNMPKGKVAVGSMPQSITIRMTTNGYSLLRYRSSARVSPITLDLNQLPLTPKNESESQQYLITSRLRNLVYSNVRGDYRLEGIMPDTLSFEFSPLAQRRVPVKVNISLSFEQQHMLSGDITIDPDSITISGPQSIVDTIYTIKSLPIQFERLSQSVSKEATLPQIQQIGFSHRRVNVIIPVEKFTEATLNLPVYVQNLPDSLKLVLLPQLVTLKCNVPLSKYQSLTAKDFNATVDFNDISQNARDRLRVRIENHPDYLERIRFEPQFLEYIIERR